MQKAVKSAFKIFDASEYKVGIVVADFNHDVTSALLKKALACCAEYHVSKKNLDVFKVPGCVEIPSILYALADSDEGYDCLIALGAIIQGETDHYIHVANVVTHGVEDVMKEGLPVGYGILTVATLAQAKARLDAGRMAAEAALQSAKLISDILGKKK